jgi:hypothetical protein
MNKIVLTTLLVMIFLSCIVIACKKEVLIPKLTTLEVTDITDTSATCRVTITNEGIDPIITRGICWSTIDQPTISDNLIINETKAPGYSCVLSGLERGTTYYVRAFATNSAGTGYGRSIVFKTILFGAKINGGIVFYYNDETKKHGLVCAPIDQSALANWGCYGKMLTGAQGLIMGTGNQNTIDIVTDCYNPGTAAKICYDLVLNGYDDWYLPSKWELEFMYSNLQMNGLGNFFADLYWSSTQADKNVAWGRYFGIEPGRASLIQKNYYLHVRAIRAF